MDTATDTAYAAAIAYATERGANDGTSAASWYFDGNTPADRYAAVLKGLEDGDPAVLDTLPSADLSGQWADSLTGPQLYRAYESAYSTAVEDEIGRAARYQLED